MGETVWKTDLPPPPGFDGLQSGEWGSLDYERDCTGEEAALLQAREAAATAEQRAEEEALRDAWLQMLRDEAAAARAPQPERGPEPEREPHPEPEPGTGAGDADGPAPLPASPPLG